MARCQWAYETGDAGTFALTFLIGVVTALPLLLFARAAQTVPLWGLGLMQYLGPSVQFFLGVMIFGEAVTPTRMTGFAVIWGGLMVFAYRTQLSESRSKGATAVECADDNALGLEPC